MTSEEKGCKTVLVMSERYRSKKALDAAGIGAADATHETFTQLDELGKSGDGDELGNTI